MKFFMTRHYSTAQKIINKVEAKITNKFAYGYYDYTVLNNKQMLAEILGNVLQNQIPDELYTKYQELNEVEKNKFREMIANNYFMKIQRYDLYIKFNKVNNIFKGGHIPVDDDLEKDIVAEIFLPESYFNEDYILDILHHPSRTIRQQLITVDPNQIRVLSQIESLIWILQGIQLVKLNIINMEIFIRILSAISSLTIHEATDAHEKIEFRYFMDLLAT